MEDSFSTDWELEGVVSRRFKHIAFIVHFISNLILPLKYLSKAQRLRTLAIEYILVAYLFCI